jgi:hypothetical protein
MFCPNLSSTVVPQAQAFLPTCPPSGYAPTVKPSLHTHGCPSFQAQVKSHLLCEPSLTIATLLPSSFHECLKLPSSHHSASIPV